MQNIDLLVNLLIGFGVVAFLIFLTESRGAPCSNFRAKCGAHWAVRKILRQCKLKRRQRWINLDSIEFVYPIVTHPQTKFLFLWARIRIRTQSARITIEYDCGLTDKGFLLAKFISELLHDYGIDSRVERSRRQPVERELGI
jgi:hypothetical protein